MKLGERLTAVAGLVPRGSRVADIGTDHAYLPVHLITSGIARYAVAGDVHRGPYEAARDTLERSGLAERIDLRLGDGIGILRPGEVDTVVIAGMGGATIIDILSREPEVVASLARLILQPMQAASSLRRWLFANGWRAVEEELAEEDGRLYEVMALERGAEDAEDAILLEIGPLLWRGRHPLLKRHISNLIAQHKRVVAEMAGSPQAAGAPKYREYQRKIAALEEKYACL
ncbi:MAG TPA: class I SAM-dependent methyltransferase [Selenomonadales bacterium]|nr:class I SAM-dependent methyltransferase [Selenomonadales bacterium]